MIKTMQDIVSSYAFPETEEEMKDHMRADTRFGTSSLVENIWNDMHKFFNKRRMGVKIKGVNGYVRNSNVFGSSIQYARKLVSALKPSDDVSQVYLLARQSRDKMEELRLNRTKNKDVLYTFHFLVSEMLPEIYADSIKDKITASQFNSIKEKRDKLEKDGGFENVFYDKLLSYSVGYQSFSVDQFTSDIKSKIHAEKKRLQKKKVQCKEKCVCNKCVLNPLLKCNNPSLHRRDETNLITNRIIMHQYLIDEMSVSSFPESVEQKSAPKARKPKKVVEFSIETRAKKRARNDLGME